MSAINALICFAISVIGSFFLLYLLYCAHKQICSLRVNLVKIYQQAILNKIEVIKIQLQHAKGEKRSQIFAHLRKLQRKLEIIRWHAPHDFIYNDIYPDVENND